MTEKWKTRLALMWLWLTMIGVCAVPVGIYFYDTLSDFWNDEINHAPGATWLQENATAITVVSAAFVLWTGWVIWAGRRSEQNAPQEVADKPVEPRRSPRPPTSSPRPPTRKYIVSLNEARRIAGDYGDVIVREYDEDLYLSCEPVHRMRAAVIRSEIAPQSLLPHPKWKIKLALQMCFISEPNLKEVRQSTMTAFIDLARYVPDEVAYNAYADAYRSDSSEVLRDLNKERSRLIAEFYSFLVDIGDNIPEAPELRRGLALVLSLMREDWKP